MNGKTVWTSKETVVVYLKVGLYKNLLVDTDEEHNVMNEK
jgi:hypothetical protein